MFLCWIANEWSYPALIFVIFDKINLNVNESYLIPWPVSPEVDFPEEYKFCKESNIRVWCHPHDMSIIFGFSWGD